MRICNLFVLMALLACASEKSEKCCSEKASHGCEKNGLSISKDSLLRHVVLFRFKEEATAEQIDTARHGFTNLAELIPEIKDFEWGLNDSPEDFHQDFTHCFLLTFESVYDRDSIYAPHKEHLAIVERVSPILDAVFVVDYWAKRP